MGGQYRMLYIVVGGLLGERLSALYRGMSAPGDPFGEFLHPQDLRGEVHAWGGPHLTVSDAMRVTDPDRFAGIARQICSRWETPAVRFESLAIFRTALVIKCESPQLNDLRLELLRETSHLIERERLEAREFEEVLDRVRERGGAAMSMNEQALRRARLVYEEHGSPPIPTSIHFRLPFLVGLVRDRPRESVDYFLRHGEPPWYASRSSLHLTICSGLLVDPRDERERTRMLDGYRQRLWKPIEELCGSQPYRPAGLAIMCESATETVRTRRYDDTIERHIEEERPNFDVLELLPFRS